MKLFHLENMQTQRTPRASAGKVLVTTVSIDNKIIGGRAQEQSSPLCDHPMYRMLEAYVIAHMAAQDEASADTHTLTPPPSAGALFTGAPRPLGLRPVDKVAPRRK